MRSARPAADQPRVGAEDMTPAALCRFRSEALSGHPEVTTAGSYTCTVYDAESTFATRTEYLGVRGGPPARWCLPKRFVILFLCE